jgi:ADP-ribosylglycohydrolase
VGWEELSKQAHICRFCKKPRKRRLLLCKILILRFFKSRFLAFYEAFIFDKATWQAYWCTHGKWIYSYPRTRPRKHQNQRRNTMTTQAKAMVLASFAADSLALGAHWIYDTAEIDRRFGRVDELLAPPTDSYHKGKERGAFTHYGDQTLVLLESLAAAGSFSLDSFAGKWRQLMTGYQGYVDKATAATLKNMEGGLPVEQCVSHSSDLGGAARIAPLVYRYRSDREALLEAVRNQTMLTHNNPATLAGAEFIAKVVLEVLQGGQPAVAMEQILEEGVADIDLDIRIRSALDSGTKESKGVIKQFGQMCGIAAALPGALHLVLRYPDDLKAALVENVMAGGDSAARGMVVGMLLGGRLGREAIPENWLNAMGASPRIVELLTAVDAHG